MAGRGWGRSAFCLFGERWPAFVNSWSLCVSQMFPSVFVLISPRQGFWHLHLSQFQESSVHAPLVQKVFEHSGGSSFFLAVLGLHCGMQASSCCGAWTCLVVASGLSCPKARGILVSPTRDQTYVLCIGRWILNHWTTREGPKKSILAIETLPCGLLCSFSFWE